jgi:hypothetical protein
MTSKGRRQSESLQGDKMILQIHLVKPNGDPIYGRSFETSPPSKIQGIPAHVKACATLYHSSSGTSRDRVYTLEQDEDLWAYLFFESMVVVFLMPAGTDFSPKRKMMQSLGKEIAGSYGDFINAWSGSIGDFEGIDTLVDQFVLWDLGGPTKREMTRIRKAVDKALEKFNVAYAGVVDATGEMLTGNIPENHLQNIITELSDDSIAPSREMVPTSVTVQEHIVQLLRVRSLVVVAASYPDAGRFPAVKAVDAIAHKLASMVKE